MDNLDQEMDKLLERYILPRLNQEEMENMNRPITSNEIESVILKLPTREVQDQMALQVNSTKHLEHNWHLSFSNYSKKFQRKEYFQTHSMRPALP